MLHTFRKLGESMATKVLLGLLVVSFALWGIQDYIGGNTGGAALTVNGRNVPLTEVDATYRNRMKTVAQMLGSQPTQEQAAILNVPGMVLTEIIHRHVLNTAASTLKLAPADVVLKKEIMNTQAFQKDGTFDAARYKQLLSNQGLTPKAYESMLAEQLALAMFSNLITVPQPNANALKPLLQQTQTTFTLETFTLTPAAITGVEKPSDDILQGFYATNAAAYTVPEKRTFQALILSPETMTATLSIPDAQIEEHYTANAAAYQTPEQRAVRHILVESSAKAVELHGQIKSRDDFLKLADTHTTDPSGKGKGGDLGTITEADVVPDFAKVAFNTPVGQVSEPVKSPFGWHLIWVESITPAAAPPLAEVRERIQTELMQTHVADALQNLMRTIDDKAAAGDPLQDIATATGLKPKTYSMVQQETNTVPASILQAAFQAEAGRVDGPIEMDDGSLAYVETTTITPASQPEFTSIKERILNDFMQAKTQSVLTELADTIARSGPVNPGKTFATIAAQVKKEGTTGTLTFTGPTDAPKWLHPHLMDIYKLPVNGALGTSIPDGPNRIMVRVTARTAKPLDDTTLTAEATSYRSRLQQDVEEMLLKHLVTQAEISYNTTQLRQIFGPQWNPPQ